MAVCSLPRVIRALKQKLSNMTLLDELSPHLRGVLTLHCFGPAIAAVPFFNLKLNTLSGEELLDATEESNSFLQSVRVPVQSCVFYST